MTAPITEVAAAVVDDGAAPMVVDGGPRFVGEPPRPVDGRELIDARDRRLDRPVVITRAATALAEADAARFLHGARVAGRLEHPAVQTILGLGVDEAGRPYYVEPRRRGVDFGAWCRGTDDGAPALGRRLTAFVDVCRAVGHAHRRGVVHGRLAPSAIDVGEAGEIRVGRWDDAVVTDGDASAPSAADHDVAAAAAHAAASAPSAADHDVAAAAHAAAAAPDVAAPHAAAAAHDVAALHALLATVLAAERDSAPELAELLAPDAAAPDATALARRVTDYLDGERDQALRADLARELTAAARAALADAAGPDRERALALARRALALDPSLDDAAGIVARLLVELPDPLPPAAQAAIVASDQRVLRRLGTGFIGAFGAFFAYVPLMVLQGVRDPTMVIAIAVASGLMLAWAIQWRVRGPHVFTWPPMVGAALVLTLYARTYGPFVNAPAQAALATMAVMFFPQRPRPALVILTFAIPVFGNLALEAIGLAATTTSVEGGHLVVTSAVVATDPTATLVGFGFVALVLVSVAGVMATVLSTSHRHHTRALVAQAWKIRALAAPLPPPSTNRDHFAQPP